MTQQRQNEEEEETERMLSKRVLRKCVIMSHCRITNSFWNIRRGNHSRQARTAVHGEIYRWIRNFVCIKYEVVRTELTICRIKLIWYLWVSDSSASTRKIHFRSFPFSHSHNPGYRGHQHERATTGKPVKKLVFGPMAHRFSHCSELADL